MLPVLTWQIIVLGLAVITQLTSGCALPNHFCESNKDNFGIVCNDVFGYDYEEKEQIAKNTYDIDELIKKQVNLETDLWAIMQQAQNVENVLQMMDGDSDTLQDRVEQLESEQTSLLIQLTQLQLTTSDLQGRVYIKEVVDFCGDAPNVIDEVGIKLSNNHIVVYFEQGNNRRLSELGPGNYVTTDGTNCHFTLNQNGTIQ